MFDRVLVPAELDEMPPGPDLAAALAGIDRSRVNGHDMVIVLEAQARQVAHEQARLLADLVEVAHCPPGGPESPVTRSRDIQPFAIDEIRAALTWTRRAAGEQLSLAMAAVERLPAVHAALLSGAIDVPRARVICDGVTVLDDEQARQVVAQVIEHAPALTTGQLRARLARLVLTIDPDAAHKRHECGATDRRLEHGLLPDGTAHLGGMQLPADRAAAAAAHVDGIARAARRAGDARTLDQLRADTFLDLLTGRPTSNRVARGGGVELTVPLTTLMGLADEPGDIRGWGPCVADIARQVADQQRQSRWRFTVLDDTGQPAHVGVTRRRPTAVIADLVRARDRTCRAPGCRVPAHMADLDHIRDWADGGTTHEGNLGVLCRHDHRVKHKGGWKYRQIMPGVFAWITPLGHTRLVNPEPRGP